MIARVAGRLLRIELLPPPLRPALRWDGTDQAHPVTLSAHLRLAMHAFAHSAEQLSKALR